MTPDVFGLGLSSTALTDLERRMLAEAPPYAVVLFARNIASVSQLRELVAEVKNISATPPLFMIDQEGGRVDRLRNLLPGLPAAEALGEGDRGAELAAWLGKVTGMALRWFDIEIDLAPVVDIRGDVASKGLEQRTFGRDPETVVALAGAFLRGLHGEGVAGCLKHFPGIGAGSADSHFGATIIDLTLDELLARDLVPFTRLGNEARAIMIGHGTYPRIEGDLPASLNRKLATDLLRNVAGFDGVAFSDDMEMHAVSDLGSLEDIAERALMAGNDAILFCSQIERLPDLQAHFRRRIDGDATVRARSDEARRRCDAYRAHCARLRTAAPVLASWDSVLEERDALVEALEKTRL
jgi:beta-N-acetylhexosaminidase